MTLCYDCRDYVCKGDNARFLHLCRQPVLNCICPCFCCHVNSMKEKRWHVYCACRDRQAKHSSVHHSVCSAVNKIHKKAQILIIK